MERVQPILRGLSLLLLLSLLCVPALAATTNVTPASNATTPTMTVTTEKTTATPTVTATTAVPISTATPVSVGSGKSWFDIYTNVDGATVFFDGTKEGTTAQGILTVPWATTGAPPKTVTATKNGYTTASEALPAVPAAGHHASVYLTLNPTTPQTGSMDFSSTPKGASVMINGVFYGTTPQRVNDLAPGTYQVSVSYPGYQSWTSNEDVVAGKITYMDPVLTTLQQYGTLSISSTPSGAYITLDGTFKGAAPRTIGGLSPGSHLVELNLPGYAEWSGRVTIYSNQVSSISETLDPLSQPSAGAISVSSTPAGATVSVDGVYYGQTPSGNWLLINDIDAGEHTVSITLDGYHDYQKTVTVTAGQTVTVDATLNAAGSGSVSLTSTPAGATVYFNDQPYGLTPVTVPNLAPGSYPVRLTYSGYEDWTGTAQVNSGATTPVSVQLVQVTPTTKSPVSPVLPLLALLIGGVFVAFRAVKRD